MAKHSILETLSDSLRKDILAGLSTHRFPAGQILFSAGEHCRGLPLVLDGSIKVQMTGASGESSVGPGQDRPVRLAQASVTNMTSALAADGNAVNQPGQLFR